MTLFNTTVLIAHVDAVGFDFCFDFDGLKSTRSICLDEAL